MKSTIRTTMAALATVAVLALSACGDDDSSAEETTSQGTESSENETNATDGTPGGERADVFDVDLGDCIGAFDAEEEVSDVTKVDCAQEHEQEVFHIAIVPDGDGSFPGEDAFKAQVQDECVAAFETFIGMAFDQSTLDIKWLEPTEQSWDEGDRELVCTVYDPAGPVTGTLEGAAR